MKKPIVLLSFLVSTFGAIAQVSEIRELPAFNSIELTGSQDVILSQGEQKVEITIEKGSLEEIITEVEDNKLKCSGEASSQVKMFISIPEIAEIKLKGSGDVYSADTITTNTLNVSLDGAGDIALLINAVNTSATLKGAGDITLKGVSNNFSAFVNGSGDIKAKNLKTQNTAATVKGVGDISVCAYDELNATVDGPGDINYYCNPEIVNKTVLGAGDISSKTKGDSDNDTTKVKFKNFDLVIIDKEDEDSSFDFLDSLDLGSKEDEKHETHLAIKYGFNGYLSNNNSINFPSSDRLFELDYARSEVFGIQYIKDIDLIDNYFKIQTGLGMDINNYMFKHNAIMLGSKDSTYMLETSTTSIQKSKLRTINLYVPFELVWKIKDFNVGAGVTGGYNIGSMTKLKYSQNGKTRKDKERGNYNVSPLSASATLKLGTENFSFFGSYNITSLFQSGKAPELYPFSVGVVFGGF